MNSTLLSILACPKCRGPLLLLTDSGGDSGLACETCSVVYPVKDGIPILLIEEAIPRSDWEARPKTDGA